MLGIASRASFESQPVGKYDTSPSFAQKNLMSVLRFSVAMYLCEEQYMVFGKKKKLLSVVNRTKT